MQRYLLSIISAFFQLIGILPWSMHWLNSIWMTLGSISFQPSLKLFGFLLSIFTFLPSVQSIFLLCSLFKAFNVYYLKFFLSMFFMFFLFSILSFIILLMQFLYSLLITYVKVLYNIHLTLPLYCVSNHLVLSFLCFYLEKGVR